MKNKKKFIYELKMQLIISIIGLIICYLICKVGAMIQNNPKLVIIPALLTLIEFFREVKKEW